MIKALFKLALALFYTAWALSGFWVAKHSLLGNLPDMLSFGTLMLLSAFMIRWMGNNEMVD